MYTTTTLPEIGCSYIPPDQCTDSTPLPCCERLKDGDGDGDGDGVDDGAGVIVKTSVALLLVLSTLITLL